MSGKDKDKRIAVVGGGLVGGLQACFLAKRGYKVDLYEFREDIRKQEAVRGRSINLALSCRGRAALARMGLEEEVTRNGIPMYARMIHDLDGTRRPIPYGTKDQYIMSIDRRRLNELVLTGAESRPNVNLHFNHKLVGCDIDTGTCTFQRMDQAEGEKSVTTEAGLIVGCDGAFSSVRRQIMKATRLDYSQEYIPHGYMELRIPPTEDGDFMMEKNYLHIWPRNEFMLIGLPNTEDNSFVLTLFMPFEMYESLNTADAILNFFQEKFPDAVDLIGKKELVSTMLASEPLALISIKCSPYHVKDTAVVMGDAAHAMVPFYGQGMNCGLEDCLVFDDLMEQYDGDFGKILPEFSAHRAPDAQAMCDLAMYNYVEMRSSVNSRLFLMRKKLDNFIHWLFPATWVPLYTMVSFTRTRYHECISRRQWQDRVLSRTISVITAASLLTAAAGGWLWAQRAGAGEGFTMLFQPLLASVKEWGIKGN